MAARAFGTLGRPPGVREAAQLTLVFGVELVRADHVFDRRRALPPLEETDRLLGVPYPARRCPSDSHKVGNTLAGRERKRCSARRHR
jgi:hypothetical protein